MSETKKKRKTLFFLGAVFMVFVMIGLFSYYSQSFSILSASKAQLGKDGVPQWLILMTASKGGEKLIFSANVQTLEPYKDVNGGLIVPQKDIELTFSPYNATCNYGIAKTTSKYQYFSNWVRFWGDKYEFYGIKSDPVKQQFINISDNNGNSKIIDGYNIGGAFEFTANDGSIMIEPQGALVGAKDCIDMSRYGIKVNLNTQKSEFFDTLDANANSLGISAISGTFIGYEVDSGKTLLTMNRGINNIGTPVLTVTADAKYLTYKYIAPQLGLPKIVSVTKPTTIQEGTLESVVVKVKNVADNKGTFKITSISTEFRMNPPFENIELGPQEEADVTFSFVAKEINKTFDGSGIFKMCALSQFEQGQCDSSNYKITITDKAIFTPSSCGDNVCSANENYATCSVDCAKQLVCDGLHKQVLNGQCICEDGFEMATDSLGREYCSEVKNDYTLMIAIIGMFITAGVIMYVVAKRRNG